MRAEQIPFSRPVDGGAGVATRDFRMLSDTRMVFSLVELGITFEIDRLRPERYGLIGEVTVKDPTPGARTINDALHTAEMNLSSMRSRADFTRVLVGRSKTPQRGWDLLVDEFCQRVIQGARAGKPALVLRDVVPEPTDQQEFEIEGLRFPTKHQTILFGDAGTAKSLLTLFVLGRLSQDGLRTALFDWELDEYSHRVRLEQLFGPATMPPIRYCRCERPLIHEVDRLSRICQDERLDFIGFDSLGYACAGPLVNDDTALEYARAVRQLGVGSIHVAHIRQGENNDARPFGSTFFHASARCTWNLKLASPTVGRINVGLYQRKRNFGALLPAIGFEIEFGSTRTTIQRVDVRDVNELAEALPLWQRMKHVLSGGPKTLALLAEELGANVETLDRTVRRKSALFTRVPSSDGVTRIGLLERTA